MKYKLIWQDLFKEKTLNPEIWNIETGGQGFGNNEDQFYTTQEKNIYIQDGILHIAAHKEKYEHKNYTSGKITTRGKKHIQYGKVEVMAKIPKGKGTWPAIWLLGQDIKTTGWPLCGEIDLMEHVGKDQGSIHFSLHSKNFNHRLFNHPTYIHKDHDLLHDFHMYSFDWDEGQITYYIDNQKIVTFNKSKDASTEDWPFNHPFYLIINLAIGGNWGGQIDDSIFPVDLQIKFVKVYERSE